MHHDDTPPDGYKFDNRNALVQFWQVVEDDEIGGKAIVVKRPGTPATGNPPVCHFVHEDHAQHIVELHNEWLDRSVRNLPRSHPVRRDDG